MALFSKIQNLINGVDVAELINENERLLREMEKIRAEFRESNHALLVQLEQVNAKNKSLSFALTAEKNKRHATASQLSAVETRLHCLERKNANLANTSEKIQDGAQKLSATNRELNNANVTLRHKVARYEKQIQDLENELRNKDAAIVALTNKVQKQRQRIREEIELTNEAKILVDTLNDENKRLRETHDRVVVENEVLTQQSNVLSEKCSRLNAELECLKYENGKILGDIESQKTTLAQVEAKNRCLSDDLQKARNNYLAAQESIDAYEEEHEALQSQLQLLNAEREELKPYMYLVEAKKEEEARELALTKAREDMKPLIDEAKSALSSLCHEEIFDRLSQVISVAQKQFEEASEAAFLAAAADELRDAIRQAEKAEYELIEKENKERRREDERLCIEAEEESLTYGNVALTYGEDDTTEDEDVFEDESLSNVFDVALIPADKLSIPEVYDVKEEKTIDARDFFCQNENELILWRRNLQEEYTVGKSRFICPECRQPVKISGHKMRRGRVCYFAHFKDSDDCPYKTGTQRSKDEIERRKYALVQESDRHKRLKAAIETALSGPKSRAEGVANVECEKRIDSDIPYLNWRRPDIYAEYNGRRMVFELQLSTTFVGVIVDRDIFYRLNDYNIIWVFNFEDNDEYVNLHNLMCKDIYYANKRNVFIFDAEAERESETRGELVLKCRWLDADGMWSRDEFVTLGMLKYDTENHKPYFVDADAAYLSKHPGYAERRRAMEHSREYLLMAMMERQRQEAQAEAHEAAKRTVLQKELLGGNESVERFASGSKYGYRYRGTTILPAIYTSAEEIGENGYARVGFNRKYGLVRSDGKEVVPVEYKNIDVINSKHGIVMASYKDISLYVGNEKYSLCSRYDDKEENIICDTDGAKVRYILQIPSYEYSYSQSRYGLHPIRRKYLAGYKKTELFAYVDHKDYCHLWIGKRTFLLSYHQLSEIDKRYSAVEPSGTRGLYLAQDAYTRRWGVIDFCGHITVDIIYEGLQSTHSAYLIVKQTSDCARYGLIDCHGREIIPPRYEDLKPLDDRLLAYQTRGKWGVCDVTGCVLHEPEYAYISTDASGELRASRLLHHSTLWTPDDLGYVPPSRSYKGRLLTLDGQGAIAFTEERHGRYAVRRSGDLYAILPSDGTAEADYTYTTVIFVSDTEAAIVHIDGRGGLFHDGESVYFDRCVGVTPLGDGRYIFASQDGRKALGSHAGPLSGYIYSKIVQTDASHLAVTNAIGAWALFETSGRQMTDFKFSALRYEDDDRYAVTEGNVKGHIDGRGNYVASMSALTTDGHKIFVLMEKYGLKALDGAEIMAPTYKRIEDLGGGFLAVKGTTGIALGRTDGTVLTEFRYSEIKMSDSGDIAATRNGHTGRLDHSGQEIAEVRTFNGGSIRETFGDYIVVNDNGETVIEACCSSIELLEDEGGTPLFALWNNGKAVIANMSKDRTQAEYDSIVPIGNGMYVVKRTKYRKTYTASQRSGAYGYQNTRRDVSYVAEKKFGIIDHHLKPMLPCKYESITGFDAEQRIVAIYAQGDGATFTLEDLRKSSPRACGLIAGTEYEAWVKRYMAIGLVVEIQGSTYIVHKKYLYKTSDSFMIGDYMNVTFLGVDEEAYPMWSTKEWP